MGITVSSCSKHTLILMAVVLHEVGDRFKMAQNQVATFLRFSIKSAAPPPYKKKKKEPTTSLLSLLSLASFKEIKVSTLYTDRGKKTAFFQLNTHCAW